MVTNSPRREDTECVDIDAYDQAGNPIEGEITTDATFDVDLILRNESDETPNNLTFANGTPLVIDPRSPGGVVMVSTPATVPSSLAPQKPCKAN